MKILRPHLLFIIILLLGIYLRGYQLDQVPPSPSLDEATIGFNAYSILRTGRDEYGTRLPILLRAYDDWRPALYVYLVIPFIKLFGLSVVAIRLPSVLMSIATLVIVYWLGQFIISPKKLRITGFGQTIHVGTVAMLLLTISPWHIYISRLGHEANLGLFLVIVGMTSLVAWWVNRQIRLLYIGGLVLAISLYGYQSQKVVTPVLVVLLTILCFGELKKVWKHVLVVAAIALGMLLPLLLVSIRPEALIRLKATSAFSSDMPVYQQASKQYLYALNNHDIVRQAWNRPIVVKIRVFVGNYLSHFNPRWLFWGDNREDHKVPGVGLLYQWEAILIVMGIVVLWKRSIKMLLLLLIWLLSGPLPAAITTQTPHAMRSFTVLPTWQLFSGVGFVWILDKTKSQWMQFAVCMVFLACVVYSLGQFQQNYFGRFPKEQSDSFQYAASQAYKWLIPEQAQFAHIIISNEGALYQSYMFYLYNSAYDPAKYLLSGGTVSGGYAKTHMIGSYDFRPIRWDREITSGRTIYIGNISDFPSSIGLAHVFNDLSGKPVIGVVIR